jgi:isoamylase
VARLVVARAGRLRGPRARPAPRHPRAATHRVLLRPRGHRPDGAPPDIAWLHPDGRELTEPDFHEHGRTLVVRLDGEPSLLLVLHAGDAPVDVLLPADFGDAAWVPVLDPGTPSGAPPSSDALPAGETLEVPAHTALVFRATPRA